MFDKIKKVFTIRNNNIRSSVVDAEESKVFCITFIFISEVCLTLMVMEI